MPPSQGYESEAVVERTEEKLERVDQRTRRLLVEAEVAVMIRVGGFAWR
jgi:hypothetical protein